MDALSSVRSPYSHLPEERVKPRHFTLGLIIKNDALIMVVKVRSGSQALFEGMEKVL